jgi:hypothetical protein
MTSPTPHHRLTARSFLFDQATGAGTVQDVGHTLSRRGAARSALTAVRHLSGSVLTTVDREIGAVAEGMLEVDLGDALVYGWRKHSALAESARRTLAVPGSEEVVLLASHRATSTYRPHVDLLVDDRLVNSFEFELKLVFDVSGLAAVVRAGDLVALRGGDCLVTATLTLEDGLIARRQHRFDPELIVRLDPPVVLAEHVTTPPPTTTGTADVA